MVVGSGPIVIGQAAEFDYAGTQACRALREEECQVVLINSNPATIMTDADMADCVYIEPLNEEFAGRVIEKERPDGLLPTLGGQTGLNLATKLAESGILDRYEVRLLGTPLRSIRMAEDRDQSRQSLYREAEKVFQLEKTSLRINSVDHSKGAEAENQPLGPGFHLSVEDGEELSLLLRPGNEVEIRPVAP